MNDNGKKPHLSPSQLSTLSRCGMQYYYRYTMGMKIPPGVAATVGKGTHKSVELNLNHKIIHDGALLPREQVEEIARDETARLMDPETVLLSPDEKLIGFEKVKGEAIDSAVSLSRMHHRDLAPKLAPTHIERPFRLELDGYPRDVVGYIDIQEGTTAIRDTKTRARAPLQTEVDRSVQLTAYALAVHALDGKAPDFVRIDALVKTKMPKIVTLESQRTMEDFQTLLLRMEYANKVIDAGNFFPTLNDQVCSERWCGYYDEVCPFGARKAVSAQVPAAAEVSA